MVCLPIISPNVVDDWDMKTTHVIRGEEWLRISAFAYCAL
jgi:hypothetical protein